MEREVARLKEERLTELLQQRAEPRGLADEQFARALYVPDVRYASPPEGDAGSVRALTRNDVRAFYAARYRPAATTLVIQELQPGTATQRGPAPLAVVGGAR